MKGFSSADLGTDETEMNKEKQNAMIKILKIWFIDL